MLGSYTSQLCQNAQVKQGVKVIFVWNKNKYCAIMKTGITKLEAKFAEREKKMNSLENKLQLDVINQSSKLGM